MAEGWKRNNGRRIERISKVERKWIQSVGEVLVREGCGLEFFGEGGRRESCNGQGFGESKL